MKTFEEAWPTLPRGWLSEPEARLLWSAAQLTEGPILEVGCFHGRSTVLLAALGRPLCCVDPFRDFDDADPSGQVTRQSWIDNVKRLVAMPLDVFGVAFLGLDSVPAPGPRVTLFCQRVEDWRPRPVGMAYLDGDHTHEGSVRQAETALACGARVVAAHDVNDYGLGVHVRDAMLKVLGPWDERVEKMAVWKNRGTA